MNCCRTNENLSLGTSAIFEFEKINNGGNMDCKRILIITIAFKIVNDYDTNDIITFVDNFLGSSKF